MGFRWCATPEDSHSEMPVASLPQYRAHVHAPTHFDIREITDAPEGK
jgi:hypothetical protein